MARFKRSGSNWEPRKFYTSKGLNALMDEIEAAYPKAGPGDGTVASKGHDAASKKSDHRPYPYTASPGVVRAVDAGEYIEDQGIAIAEAIRKSRDPRIKYVIHEGRLFSSYNHSNGPAWSWRPYAGTVNPHKDHVHVSLNSKGDSDGSPWNLGLKGGNPLAHITVEQWQEILNEAGQKGANGKVLTVDDKFGPNTKHALVQASKPGGAQRSAASIRAIIAKAISNG